MSVLAALFALFAWWFSTGIILLAVRRSDKAGGMAPTICVLWGLPFLAFGLFAAWATRMDGSVLGVYQGFVAALALWVWIELAFLTGVITGPNKQALPPHTKRRAAFWAAWRTVAYHELALLAGLTTLIWMAVDAINASAALTFGTLWVARVLAKLNLFLGVPGINLEAIPSRLAHIPSYFRRDEPSWLFPISVLILGGVTAAWIAQVGIGTPAQTVTAALLAALTGLALIEHWMMLLPLADTKLWRWLTPAPQTDKKTTELGET